MTRTTLARLTGLAYAGMLPGGLIGFVTIRATMQGDTAAETLANIAEHGTLVRWGIVGMLSVVLAQALASWAFYSLFRASSPTSAWAIAGFGLVNATLIGAGAAGSMLALHIAENADQFADPAGLAHVFYLFEGNAWAVGNIFFGLWLIPMGWAARTTGYFHAGKVLGWILMVGGVGYTLAAFATVSPQLADSSVSLALSMPATVGEFWMIFALLIVGIRKSARGAVEAERDHERVAA